MLRSNATGSCFLHRRRGGGEQRVFSQSCSTRFDRLEKQHPVEVNPVMYSERTRMPVDWIRQIGGSLLTAAAAAYYISNAYNEFLGKRCFWWGGLGSRSLRFLTLLESSRTSASSSLGHVT